MYACAKHDRSGGDAKCPSCAAERSVWYTEVARRGAAAEDAAGIVVEVGRSMWHPNDVIGNPCAAQIQLGYQVPPGDPCPTCGQAMSVSWRSVFNGREFVQTATPEWTHSCSWCADPRTKKLREVLRALEWCVPHAREFSVEYECPCCSFVSPTYRARPDKGPRHAADCPLAAAVNGT